MIRDIVFLNFIVNFINTITTSDLTRYSDEFTNEL